ncbi:hypothetical protein [Streptomyces sp. NPDC054787]
MELTSASFPALDADALTGDPRVLADPARRERNSPLVRPAGGRDFRTWTGLHPDALGWLSTELVPPGGRQGAPSLLEGFRSAAGAAPG